MNIVGEGQKWSFYSSAQECKALLPSLGSQAVCCSRQMNLQMLFQMTPAVCEAPLVFVVCAQLLLEEPVLRLDILGMAFATTYKQSPSEPCLAVIAGGSPLSPAIHPWDHITWKSDFSSVCEKQPS